MAKIERGVALVERIIERIAPYVTVTGASSSALDRLESQLMVELPPTLRRFLEFDFGFASFGKRWRGRGRFGMGPAPRARASSLRRLAAAMTDEGWTSSRLRRRVVRLPNLPGEPWNCLYLGEARADGELPILGLVNDETTVMPYFRYSAFDLYLVEQSGLVALRDSLRLDDVESHLVHNPDLSSVVPDEYNPG
ncbi:MAG: SMI1/KNR4 family protein [Myxococcales bacterium]|nr:SMI1/KNR4 family protein [Myxococcales bacterium]